MAKRKDFKILAKINNIPTEEAELIYLEPGNRLGPNNRYEIINLIGTGSIGAVYLAIDREENKSLLALKMVLPHLLENEAKLDSFIENITELQYLKHPNVALIYDFWKQNILYFYTMEHIEGPTLEEWMAQRQQRGEVVSLAQAHKIIDQICSGLAVLHNTGGHYLLHANNILVAKDEKPDQIEVKICDFGLYHLQPGDFWWQAGSHFDTRSYLAPELRENSKLTEHSDIFSVAVLLYRLLTWQNPGPEYCSLKSLRSDLPNALDDVLQKALQSNPQLRHSDVQSFVQHLAIVLEDVNSQTLGRIIRTPLKKKRPVSSKKGTLAERLAEARLKFKAQKKLPKSEALPKVAKSPTVGIEGQTVPAIVPVAQPQILEESRHETSTASSSIMTASNENATPDADFPITTADEKSETVNAPPHSASQEERHQWLLQQANAQVSAKRYDEAIDLLEKSLALNRTSSVIDLLRRLRSYQQQTAQLKEKADQTNDIYKKLELLNQAQQISPHDQGLLNQIVRLQQKIDSQDQLAERILETGDRLVAEGKYEQAILTWKNIAVPTRRQKEIEDRIMQVVDMLAEEASTMINDGKPYDARRTLSKIAKFSDDPLIEELEEEILQNIQQRESRFKQALKEGQKHFIKKQYAAAVEVWEHTLGTTENDYLLLEKIAKAKELEQARHGDEKDYLDLVTMARALEKREDYQGALQALERIKRRNWLCPVSDIRPDIEKISKLAAAQSYAQQALDLLAQVSQALSRGKLTEARESLNDPVLRRTLIPSIVKRHQSVSEQFEKKQEARKIFWRRLILAGGFAVLSALTLGFLILFVK